MVLLSAIRAFFVMAVVAVVAGILEEGGGLAESGTKLLLGAFALALGIIALEVFLPRKSLTALSGVFFGLVVGLVLSFGLALVINHLHRVYLPTVSDSIVGATKTLFGIIFCYLCVSFILQTKDDVRFVIPYVEFAKQIKGQHPLILDTSVIIDGRISDISETGIIDQQVIVPRFVLQELHAIADSGDRLKRNRGRRGLDVLNNLQASKKIDIQILDAAISDMESAESVDHRLVSLAKHLNGRVVTNDYNLNKVARLHGVAVININDLAGALRPVALPGESLRVKVVKVGEEAHQGVGYLEDGTMVVVENGRQRVGETLDVVVKSVLQTSAGRMIFARHEPAETENRRS
jgi:uncharacterized protein YacL